MEQRHTQQRPPAEADVFDMEARSEAPKQSSTNAQSAMDTPSEAKRGIGAHVLDQLAALSVRNLAIITIGITGLGLIVPRLFESASTQPSGNAQLLVPSPHSQPAMQQTEEKIVTATPEPTLTASAAPNGPPLDATSQAPDLERTIVRTALEDLNARLVRLETAANQVATAASVAPITSATALPPSTNAALTAGAAAAPAPRRRAPATKAPVPVLHGYSLNTIYPRQAWIEHGGATYAVQVGDTIGGVAILAIDPRTRTVTTSLGQIR